MVADLVESMHAEHIVAFADNLMEKPRGGVRVRVAPLAVEFIVSLFPRLLLLLIVPLNQFLK